MRRNFRKWALFAVGACLIGLSVMIDIRLTRHYRDAATMMTTLKPTRYIQAGEVVEAGMTMRIPIPIDAHDREASVDLGEVIGKTALVPIGLNEEFLRWKLADRPILPGNGESYYSFKSDKLQNDANLVRRGDRVDVWVEFDAPRWLRTPNGRRIQIGSVKIIESLLVADVKTADGSEVTDSPGSDGVLGAIRGGTSDANRRGLEQARAKPSGLPDVNTYVMREDIYNAYTLGMLGGTVKLSLTEAGTSAGAGSGVGAPAGPPAAARLTEMFKQLKETDIFSKEAKKPDYPVSDWVPEEVAGQS